MAVDISCFGNPEALKCWWIRLHDVLGDVVRSGGELIQATSSFGEIFLDIPKRREGLGSKLTSGIHFDFSHELKSIGWRSFPLFRQAILIMTPLSSSWPSMTLENQRYPSFGSLCMTINRKSFSHWLPATTVALSGVVAYVAGLNSCRFWGWLEDNTGLSDLISG